MMKNNNLFFKNQKKLFIDLIKKKEVNLHLKFIPKRRKLNSKLKKENFCIAKGCKKKIIIIYD